VTLMSNCTRSTRNPRTRQFELANWWDDHYGAHVYGVHFASTGMTYRESEHRWEFLDAFEPQPVPWEQLGWLTEIPVAERSLWVMAPTAFNYSEAEAWARARGYGELMPLSTGETLVRITRPAEAAADQARYRRTPIDDRSPDT
jgi:hypothetical protein